MPMTDTHDRVTKAVGPITGKSLVSVEADDIRELAQSVTNPSQVVQDLLAGVNRCKPGVQVWQQAKDVRELLAATGSTPSETTSP